MSKLRFRKTTIYPNLHIWEGIPGGSVVRYLPAKAEDAGLIIRRKTPGRRKWQPIPKFLHGKSHDQRSLMGYSPWGCKRAGYNSAAKHHHQEVATLTTTYMQSGQDTGSAPTKKKNSFPVTLQPRNRKECQLRRFQSRKWICSYSPLVSQFLASVHYLI